MSEPDPIGDRYRELAREAPPPELDAAILAASRRAVGARPGGAQRWIAPVSVAAVLVLGIGVALRMQVEQPGIETSAPQSEYPVPSAEPTPPSEYSVPPSEPDPPSEPAPPKQEAQASGEPPRKAKAAAAVAATAAPDAAPPPASDLSRAAPPKRELQNRAAAAEAPRPTMDAARSFAPEPPAAMRAPAPSAPPQAPAAGSMATREAAPVMADTGPTPEAELERIARLREASRNDAADRALAAFQRRFPDYRIPAAVWERVRSR